MNFNIKNRVNLHHFLQIQKTKEPLQMTKRWNLIAKVQKNNLYGEIRHRELEQMESKVNLQGLIEGLELVILIDRQH